MKQVKITFTDAETGESATAGPFAVADLDAMLQECPDKVLRAFRQVGTVFFDYPAEQRRLDASDAQMKARVEKLKAAGRLCPDCEAINTETRQHSDNGCKGMDLSWCCYSCGGQWDVGDYKDCTHPARDRRGRECGRCGRDVESGLRR